MAWGLCRWRNLIICVCTPCICMFLLSVYIVIIISMELNSHATHNYARIIKSPFNPHFVAPGVINNGSYPPLPTTFWNQQGHKALWSQLQLLMDHHFNPILRHGNITKQQSTRSLDTFLLRQSFSEKKHFNNMRSKYEKLPQQLQRFVRYMLKRDYPVVLKPRGVCGAQVRNESEHQLLLFAIKSKEGNFENRQAIRGTWGKIGWVNGQWTNNSKEGGGYIHRVFLLGRGYTKEEGANFSALLKLESEYFGDILQWDFEDTFFNLTLKDILLWRWFSKSCGQTAFVFKGDDDVFVNTPRMVAYLLDQLKMPHANETMKDFMVGDAIVAASPNRNNSSKYFIPDSFFSGYYPRYLGGGGVVYSGLLTKRLHHVSSRVHLYPIDDVYVGMCMIRLNALPVHHPAFLTFGFPAKEEEEACSYHTIFLVHKRSPRQIVKLWTNMARTQTACQHVPLRSGKKKIHNPI